MAELSRRTMVGLSAGSVAALCLPRPVLAAAQCPAGPLPAFLPNWLSVDCASRRNFQTFRRNSDFLGLAGVVTMSFVRGEKGEYPAGNLFLFPWVKPKGKDKTFSAVVPTNLRLSVNGKPIPGGTIPPDEYFCRFVLQAPITSFIGFEVDNPYDGFEAKQDWFTNVELADRKSVGIDWTSSNLNGPWFGGSHWIPNTETCNGEAWRKLILAGLKQASSPTC